ncbi:MAG: extracellular solute-binding protein [Fimbriimonadaceae bacterium]|nr:extracellular solute-binding protein [Alphaproteobacteria bacterium]
MRFDPIARARSSLWLMVLIMTALGTASAALAEPRHGLSAFGDLKYPADFRHFDYVNPDAPKSGRLAMIGTAGLITFDSFNGFILKGNMAQGLSYLFDTLMTRAGDEEDAAYGLVAHSAELAPDKSSVTFFLRPEARFADGTPVRASDVVASFNLIKAHGHPFLSMPLRDVTSAEALDPLTVRYTFQGDLVRDLPLLVADLPIFSKAYYETRDFALTSLDPPLGSGPYRIADYRQGRFVQYELRDDYWGKDLPVNRGRFNFRELRYEYFRDRTTEFEALKAGAYDLREEFTSKTWATEYDIPQVRDGRLLRATLPDHRPSGAQGFFINTRKEKFADPRVRRALSMAFDFEWTNRNQFHDSYIRTASFFENSPMKAEGAPTDEELALLETWRTELPEAVFGEAVMPPVSDGSGQDRKLLRQAAQLLREAGWNVQDGVRRNADGETLSIEFLIFAPTFERIVSPFVKNLKLLGIEASIRRVDPAQFEERVKSFDFDILTRRYVITNTPGAELRNYWGSHAATLSGSRNLSGIQSPVVDALIEKVVGAATRRDLIIAARALDRVLRAGHYWIPHWYKASYTVAYWNKFSAPAIQPKYDRGIIETWWFDEDKARALIQAQ